jgi:hypothetical protein
LRRAPSIINQQGNYFMTSLYAPLSKVEKKSDGTLRIRGIASSETVDHDGEVILASAMKAAIPGFLAHGTGALREMHRSDGAAGTVDEVEFDDKTKMTKIVATVIDKAAIEKVVKGVYKGVSVGGKILKRNEKNPKLIEQVSWVELSLVDRPSNPTSTFSIYKVGGFRTPTGSRDVGWKLPDAGGAVKSVAEMWEQHGAYATLVEKMPEGAEKADARRTLEEYGEKIVAVEHTIRNQARAKARDEKSKLFPQPHEHPALS